MAEASKAMSRREAVQRVQFGLLGFGAVLLIVAFANLIGKTVRPDTGAPQVVASQQGAEAPSTANGVADSAPADSEPLASLGVTPRSDTAPPATGPSVPDLEPDPRLTKPMDQAPRQTAPASPRH